MFYAALNASRRWIGTSKSSSPSIKRRTLNEMLNHKMSVFSASRGHTAKLNPFLESPFCLQLKQGKEVSLSQQKTVSLSLFSLLRRDKMKAGITSRFMSPFGRLYRSFVAFSIVVATLTVMAVLWVHPGCSSLRSGHRGCCPGRLDHGEERVRRVQALYTLQHCNNWLIKTTAT